jgi:hypothetical protein
MNYFKATTDAQNWLDLIAPEWEKDFQRIYVPGYESFFERLPIIEGAADPQLVEKLKIRQQVVHELAVKLRADKEFVNAHLVKRGYKQFILALEQPLLQANNNYKEGAKLQMISWAPTSMSAIHSHSPTYFTEDVIVGKFRVIEYQMYDEFVNGLVRATNVKVADINNPAPLHDVEQNSQEQLKLVHEVLPLTQALTLHFAEKRNNGHLDFFPQFFEEERNLWKNDVIKISTKEAMYLQPGDVTIVRSKNVSELGDHYIVVTGPPILKAHGIRPQNISIPMNSPGLLDYFDDNDKIVMLKLRPEKAMEFLEYHKLERVLGRALVEKNG